MGSILKKMLSESQTATIQYAQKTIIDTTSKLESEIKFFSRLEREVKSLVPNLIMEMKKVLGSQPGNTVSGKRSRSDEDYWGIDDVLGDRDRSRDSSGKTHEDIDPDNPADHCNE